MIQPTLFVGLGTTGTNILKNLRELMSEEYGHAGLPIFRYIAIETDAAMDASNTNQMKDYERINLISATIGKFGPVQWKLTPGHPQYDPYLVEWLNPELLKFAGAFNAGAANIRMAGRLCLWENWGKMQGAFAKAQAAVIAPAAMKEAEKILGKPLDDGGGGINVYVVGTLCGGSCSGMLVDVGYFCKNTLGASANVHGIFTMYDEVLAMGAAAPTVVQSANCYASLQELNYYSHLQTTYLQTIYGDNYSPPIGMVQSSEPPFDYTMLVSPSGIEQNVRFVKEGGIIDLDGLNLMVALNLFADAAGDTDGKKEAIRINFQGFPGFGTLKPVEVGKIPTMMKSMASFGLTAVWYPKYRIASAAACLISQKLCNNWMDTHTSEAESLSDAQKAWDAILSGNKDVLTSPKGQPPLKSRIATLINQAKQAFDRATSTDKLSGGIEMFPFGDPFRNKFDRGGEYIELMEMQVSESKKAFLKAIEQTLNNQFAKIDFQGTYGLGDVQAFFAALDREIEGTIGKCPTSAPSLDLSNLDFEQIRSAENNRWTKLIGLHDKSVEGLRKELIDNYCRLISGSPESIYVTARNYYLRPVLQEIREELGFGMQPMKIDGPNHSPTIKDQLDQIAANLNDCVKKFTEDYEKAIDPPTSECVKIVTNNPKNCIDTDAKHLSFDIINTINGVVLLQGETMARLLEKQHTDLTTQMMETYRRVSLSQIQGHDVVKKALEILNTGGTDIRNLARRSNPYQPFIEGFVPFDLDPPPKIIFGHDPTGKVFGELQLKLEFPGKGESSVEHLLFFYQEEAGFTIDDLGSYKTLKQHFDKTPGPYGHSTHQDADFYDLLLHHKTEKLERWCRALGKLVPEICRHINKDAFSGILYPVKNAYVFEYDVDGLSARLNLHDNSDGIKRLSEKQNQVAYDGFFKSVQFCFARLDPQQIKQLINSLLSEVEDDNAYTRLSKFFHQFLDEVYANGDSIGDATDDAGAELDANFFRATPQTHENILPDEPTKAQSIPNQNVGRESYTNATENTDDYDEVNSEETEYDPGTFTDTVSNSRTGYSEETTATDETSTVSEDPMPQDSTADANGDDRVWVEPEPETAPKLIEDPVEEPFTDEDFQPEGAAATDKQKKQAQPSKEFSVTDIDVKQLTRRGNTRKKE